MTNEHNNPELVPSDVNYEDLDGHSIDELSDYLDAGRLPRDSSIEESAGCRLALDALERLHHLSVELVAADVAAEPEVDDSWVQKILAGITLDARAGRRIPFAQYVQNADLGITEGAIRGLIRSAENAVPGVVVGKCQLNGEVTELGESIDVKLDVSVPYGDPIPDLVTRLRLVILRLLERHTDLNIGNIDITVHDIHDLPNWKNNNE